MGFLWPGNQPPEDSETLLRLSINLWLINDPSKSAVQIKWCWQLRSNCRVFQRPFRKAAAKNQRKKNEDIKYCINRCQIQLSQRESIWCLLISRPKHLLVFRWPTISLPWIFLRKSFYCIYIIVLVALIKNQGVMCYGVFREIQDRCDNSLIRTGVGCCFLLKLEYYSSKNLLKLISNKTLISTA